MTVPSRYAGIYKRALERFGRSAPGNWFLTRIAPRIDPPLLRISGGRFSSAYPVQVMLLTTTGAKSGLRRQLPLLYVADGDSLILVASNYGRPGHPAWYRNLKANPTVEVLAGKYRGSFTATEITDPAERAEAWSKALDVYAGYSDYEARAANRTIPLIRLRP